jgi:dipeptidyl aminopeptidase/acylaminoacyl peptidase
MGRLFDRLGLNLARRLRQGGERVDVLELQLRSTAGYRIAATVFSPQAEGPAPAVVLCPGADHDRRAFSSKSAPVRAEEVAALGFVVLIFDPSGRGESWGPEDFGGTEHQDNVAIAVQWLRACPSVDPDHVGLVGISLGVASAVGAARRLADAGCPVAWVIDWEGPCDRRSITAEQTMNAPAMGHRYDDDSYWFVREAVHHVSHIRCGYLRLQANPDHAQPGELGHAEAMMAAVSGSDLDWFRLNAHPEGVVPEHPRWLRPGPLQANRALIQALRQRYP